MKSSVIPWHLVRPGTRHLLTRAAPLPRRPFRFMRKGGVAECQALSLSSRHVRRPLARRRNVAQFERDATFLSQTEIPGPVSFFDWGDPATLENRGLAEADNPTTTTWLQRTPWLVPAWSLLSPYLTNTKLLQG